MPKRPSLATSFASSRGRMPCSNHSPTSGTIRSRTNRRTVSRIAFSSSSRSASMARKSRGSSSVGFAVIATPRMVEQDYCAGARCATRQREPGFRVALPQLLFVAAGVDPEDVRDAGTPTARGSAADSPRGSASLRCRHRTRSSCAGAAAERAWRGAACARRRPRRGRAPWSRSGRSDGSTRSTTRSPRTCRDARGRGASRRSRPRRGRRSRGPRASGSSGRASRRSPVARARSRSPSRRRRRWSTYSGSGSL